MCFAFPKSSFSLTKTLRNTLPVIYEPLVCLRLQDIRKTNKIAFRPLFGQGSGNPSMEGPSL